MRPDVSVTVRWAIKSTARLSDSSAAAAPEYRARQIPATDQCGRRWGRWVDIPEPVSAPLPGDEDCAGLRTETTKTSFYAPVLSCVFSFRGITEGTAILMGELMQLPPDQEVLGIVHYRDSLHLAVDHQRRVPRHLDQLVAAKALVALVLGVVVELWWRNSRDQRLRIGSHFDEVQPGK